MSLALLVYDSDRFSEDDMLAYTLVPLHTLLDSEGNAGDVSTVDYMLCPSQMQLNAVKAVSVFSSNNPEPEQISLRVSLCLHKLPVGDDTAEPRQQTEESIADTQNTRRAGGAPMTESHEASVSRGGRGQSMGLVSNNL